MGIFRGYVADGIPTVEHSDNGLRGPWTPLERPDKYRSAEGFAWGYAGAGPTELAYAIALVLYPAAMAEEVTRQIRTVLAGLDMDAPWELEDHLFRRAAGR